MKNTIRKYRNTVQVNFAEKGNNFTLKVPHYKKWLSVMAFLRNRGFKVGKNEYYEKQAKCLSPYHKTGTKRSVTCLMEITAKGFTIEFGDTKNLWKDMPNNFWDNPSDIRYTKLTYLENKAVELEIFKLMNFCKRFDVEKVVDIEITNPAAFIVDKLKHNKHIHGDVTCLNDIAIDMQKDNYNSQQNNNDKNKKKIVCGEKKYFYDYYTRRLMCGQVWHNINNMWWVICGNVLRNVSSGELFDYSKGLAKRNPLTMAGYEKLLKKMESAKKYKSCIAINNLLESLQTLTTTP